METRSCNRVDCPNENPQPIDKFSKNGNRRRAECKDCQYKGTKKWNIENADRKRASHKRWAKENPDFFYATQVERLYGITWRQYRWLDEQQNSKCSICRNPPNEGKRLHIDHDHSCCNGRVAFGKCIRGLLCSGCNGRMRRIDRLNGKIGDYGDHIIFPVFEGDEFIKRGNGQAQRI